MTPKSISTLGRHLQEMMKAMLKAIEINPEPVKHAAEPEKTAPVSVKNYFE